MIRLAIPGGSYGEAFPGGLHFALVGKDVQTHAGTLVNPLNEAVQQPRWHPNGSMIGQGHDTGLAVHYDGATRVWMRLGPTCGVNSCAFNADGSIVINTNCHLGTQGIRWIDPDGTIHTGDSTYDGRGSTGVAEWTQLGDVLVGQSYVDGCTIRRAADVPRQLERGHCTFARFNRDGNQLAVALWKQQENCCVLFWLTVDEIAALPPEPTAPQPQPNPQPHPIPQPSPIMNYNTGPLQTYANERWSQLPHETREEQAASLFRILYEYRQQTGDPIEVFRKGRVGTHFLGSDGEGYAEDICVINEGANGKWFRDVGVSFGIPSARLDFGPGWARPSPGDDVRCFPPPPPSGTQPPPIPQPHPQPPDLERRLQQEIEARVALQVAVKQLGEDLRASIASQGGALAHNLAEAEDRLNQRINDLPPAALPSDVVRESTHHVKTNAGRFLGTFTGTIERENG